VDIDHRVFIPSLYICERCGVYLSKGVLVVKEHEHTPQE
jgi:hypothetical protein